MTTGAYPRSVEINGGFAYVANASGNTVDKINTSTMTVV
jgi:DNA-binding beta-propeller fold protein YncE